MATATILRLDPAENTNVRQHSSRLWISLVVIPTLLPHKEMRQAKIDAENSHAENSVMLQNRVSQQLADIWKNRDGATYANPQERARLERQLKTTLQVASAQESPLK